MKPAHIALLLLLSLSSTGATEFPKPMEIIQNEGQFVFTDGSSFYLFKKDGSFTSEPLGLSGRVITGTWTFQEDRLFVIQGRWSWINGLSAEDDYREMKLAIYRPVSSETVEQLSVVGATTKATIYRCYFVVEELQKTGNHKTHVSVYPVIRGRAQQFVGWIADSPFLNLYGAFEG